MWWVLGGVAVWLVVALPVALLVGRSIRLADRKAAACRPSLSRMVDDERLSSRV